MTARGPNPLDAGGYGRVAIIAQIKAVLLCNRYLEFLCFGGRAGCGVDDAPGSAGLRPRRSTDSKEVCWKLTDESARSDPLTELGLADVVDVDADAADVAFVDLDLVQIRSGVRESGW